MRDLRPLAAAIVVLTLAACGSTVQQVDSLGTGPGGGAGVTGADGLTVPGSEATTGTDSLALADPGSGTAAGSIAGGGPAGGSAAPGAAPGTTAGAAPGQAAPGQAGAAGTAQLPPKGRGWDEEFVYVGVNTQKDVQRAAETVGAGGIDGGDQEAQAQVLADELNRRGGLFGRKIKVVFRDHATIATAQDPNSAANATCTYFTQDRPVVALVNPVTLLDVPSFRSCMAKGKVPVLSASVQAVDAKVGRDLAPYFYQSVAPAWDALAPVLAQQLEAQGYFSGWDPRTGSPAPGAAKLGIVVPDDEVGRRVEAIVTRAMKAVGSGDLVPYRYPPNDAANSMNSAVLQFAGNGVTHVVTVNSDLVAFMLAADNQNYRPRYAVTSYSAPVAFLENVAPDRQVVGAVGVGWTPSLDVNDANDPGPTGPAETECLDVLAKGGQTYKGKRLAEAVGLAFCDGLRLVVTGSTTGGGLSGEQIFRGILTTGNRFQTGLSFANGIRPDRLSIPGAVRQLTYVADCRCFRYASGQTIPL